MHRERATSPSLYTGRYRQMVAGKPNPLEGAASGNLKTGSTKRFILIGYEPQEGIMSAKKEVTRSGITFGCALAIAISWSANKSILWAIIHGLFSWLYVIYYYFRYHTA